MRRIRIALWLLVALALAAFAFLMLRPMQETPTQPQPLTISSIGGPFTLTGSDGKPFSSASLAAKPYAIFFGFTNCPDVCPTDLVAIGSALKLLGPQAADIQPLFITLDPARDTPQVLREYAPAFHPSFVALRGTAAETRRIAHSYKVFYDRVPDGNGGYAIDHAAFTFLLDREGKYVAFFPPGTRPERMATMLKDNL